MSINVNFYSFAKKENSTKIPSGTPTTYACVLKDSCGILNPSIVLDLGATGNPASLNYAYISAFNRYYFVDEWNYNKGLWEASLRVDVLASYKTAIGSSTQYVLRAAQNTVWDGSIKDDYYPAKGFATSRINSAASDPWNLDSGTLVLGIVGGNPSSVKTGAVQYYAFTTAQAKSLFDFLFRGVASGSGNTFIDIIIGASDLVEEAVKTTLNPFQYIVSAKYYPFSISGTSVSTISFGWWSLPFTATMLGSIPYKIIGPVSFTIPKHPQATTRGAYLNQEPYSRYSIEFPPFGVIPLDSTVVGNASTVYAYIQVDCATGMGKLMLTTDSTATTVTIGTYKTEVGVDVQISQTNIDVVGTLANAYSTLASGYSAITTGFGIESVAAGIGNTIGAALPQTQMLGKNSSDIDFILLPWIVNRTINIVDSNDDHAGRPVCKELQINTLSGYVQCSDGELDLSATANELAQIRSNLTGGFFYE